MASPVSASDVLMQQDTHQHLRIVAIFVIFVSSLVGVLLPVAFRSRKEGLAFSFVKQIGSGVVLATGVVHVLPDANAALSDPALGWPNYPVAYVIAVAAAITVMSFEGGISAMITKHVRAATPPALLSDEEANKAQPEHTEAQHTKRQAEHSLRVRLIAVAQVLETGIAIHSVFIGISIGVEPRLSVIQPLLIALIFHQGFEGFALGACLLKAQLQRLSYGVMAFVFASTTPLGIVIGLAIQTTYDAESPKALVLAGILMYLAFVSLMAEDFIHSQHTRLGLAIK